MNIKTLLRSIFSKGKKDIADERKARTLADLELKEEVEDKQDIISDLASIRSGAELGATAVQDNNYVHTDNNFTNTDKGNISKALYFKGAYDSADGKTRKSWIVDLSKLNWTWDPTSSTEFEYWWSGDLASFIKRTSSISDVPTWLVSSLGYTPVATVNMVTGQNQMNVYYSNGNLIMTTPQSTRPSGTLQFELVNSYTDDGIIENQSLLPLDSGMANELRGLITDGLNLFDTSNIVKTDGYWGSTGSWHSASGMNIYGIYLKAGSYVISYTSSATFGVYTLNNNGGWAATTYAMDSTSSPKTFTLVNDSYIGFAVYVSQISIYMLNEGSNPYPYEKFNGKLARVPYVNSQDIKSLYHLGAYDSIVGETSDTVTVNRKTMYIDTKYLIDNLYLNDYWEAQGKYVFGINIPEIVSVDQYSYMNYKDYVDNNCFPTPVYNNTYAVLMTISQSSLSDNYLYWGRVSREICFRKKEITTLAGMKAYFSSLGPISIQLQAESVLYTETLIKDRHLNTLDLQGSEWLRNEWEKTLQVWQNGGNWSRTSTSGLTGWTIDSTVTLASNATNWACMGGYLTGLKRNTNYTITCNYSGPGGKGGFRHNDSNMHVGTSNGKRILRFNTGDSDVYYFEFYCNYGSTVAGTYTFYKVMLVEGNLPYPYEEYNGAIVHERDAGILLWKNPSPASQYAGGTDISISTLANYKYIVIEYIADNYSSVSNYGHEFKKVSLEVGAGCLITLSYVGYINNRSITRPSATTLQFSGCTYIDLAATALPLATHTDNKRMIPIAIYGANIL